MSYEQVSQTDPYYENIQQYYTNNEISLNDILITGEQQNIHSKLIFFLKIQFNTK